MFSAAANTAMAWQPSLFVKLHLESLNENSTEAAEELAKYMIAQSPIPGIYNF